MKIIRVVAAVIRDRDRIFATARGYGAYKGGWEFPGGKIEPGETPQEALVREIREELDTEIVVGNLIDTIEYDYPEFHLSMDCFWCAVREGHLTLKEAEASRWLTADTIDSVDWLPADRSLIDRIRMDLSRAEKAEKIQCFAAVCGVKNSGKTTLTQELVRIFSARGLKTAVIKHDGHAFDCDFPGTDSYRFVEAGACGAAVFSGDQIFIRKRGSYPGPEDSKGLQEILDRLIDAFPEADVVLAEGLKGLPVPKLEVVRGEISRVPVSNPAGRFLVVSDLAEDEIGERTLPFGELDAVADLILEHGRRSLRLQ